jgi:hypothetical protein
VSGNQIQAIVCYTHCYPCRFDEHHEPPQWHTWADDEDIQHAKATGLPDPTQSRCA